MNVEVADKDGKAVIHIMLQINICQLQTNGEHGAWSIRNIPYLCHLSFAHPGLDFWLGTRARKRLLHGLSIENVDLPFLSFLPRNSALERCVPPPPDAPIGMRDVFKRQWLQRRFKLATRLKFNLSMAHIQQSFWTIRANKAATRSSWPDIWSI